MLYANTDDGSSALWVLDGNGVVVDNISYSIAARAPILSQINEHYGTSFTGWSDNEIGLRIGDTLPNWNAYEKIEMPKPFLWKMRWQGTSSLIFGKVENNTLTSFAMSIENPYLADENGLIIGSSNISTMGFDYIVKPKLNQMGITFDKYAFDTSSYSMNENVQNWQEFTDIS